MLSASDAKVVAGEVKVSPLQNELQRAIGSVADRALEQSLVVQVKDLEREKHELQEQEKLFKRQIHEWERKYAKLKSVFSAVKHVLT